MTTVFFLLRHAAHDNLRGFLAGRMGGISLGEAGLAQAARLGLRLAREEFAAIYSSPRERAQETAAAIALACGTAPAETTEALDEIDFGHWSGRTFVELDADPLWRRWNTQRSITRTPGGETMLDVQQRVLEFVQKQAEAYRGTALVLVSHADVIKAAVGYFLGLPIDAWPRFDIAPASITSVATGEWGAKILTLNEVVS